jgi:hypothetical protein
MASEKRVDAIVWAALALAAFAVFFSKIYDYDIFYHLAIGREIFRLGHLPGAEFYLWSDPGRPSLFHEWGFGLIFYLATAAGGYFGASLLNAALAAAAALMVLAAALGGRRPGPVVAVLFFALLMILGRRMIYRPEMILYITLAAEIWALESYLRVRSLKRLVAVPMAASFILAQAHPSGFILLLAAGAYGIQALAEDRNWNTRFRTAGAFLLLAGLMTAAHLVNPYGLEQALAPFRFAGQEALLSSNADYIPIWASGDLNLFLALVGLFLYAVVTAKKKRPGDMLLLLGFGLLAAIYARNITAFGLVAAVPVLRRGMVLEDGLKPKEHLIWRGLTVLVLGLALAGPVRHHTWGWGPWAPRFPERLTAELSAHPEGGKLLNAYELGGWLAWNLYPPRQIFIDGRHYENSAMLQDYSDIAFGRPGWEDVLARRDADIALLPAFAPVTGELMPCIANFARNPDWLYFGAESGSVLFVRADRAGDFAGLSPQPPELAEGLAALVAEQRAALGEMAVSPEAENGIRALAASDVTATPQQGE